MEKNLWVIANWKSNKNLKEALEWMGIVGPNLSKRENIKVVVCPQFSELEEVNKAIRVGNFPLIVGSQDLSPFPAGAFTGEESASTLHQYIGLAILGHSERREAFGETDEIVKQKVKQANDQGITPLVCVQESTTPIPDHCQLIAYEPIFAIGTGNPDTPENANKMAAVIKSKQDNKIEVLYGGSVNSRNVAEFVKMEHLSGVLVGKASLDGKEFVRIVRSCY